VELHIEKGQLQRCFQFTVYNQDANINSTCTEYRETSEKESPENMPIYYQESIACPIKQIFKENTASNENLAPIVCNRYF